MAARRGLLLMNTGKTPTFNRAGNVKTIPDITLALEGVASLLENWEVLEDYTWSDHQYIQITIRGNIGARTYQGKHKGWNVSKMDVEKLSLTVIRGNNRLTERIDIGAKALV